MAAHLAQLEAGIESRIPGGGAGVRALDDMRIHLEAAARTERRLLRQRLAPSRRAHAWNATVLILAGSVAALALMAISGIVLSALLRRARAAETRTRDEEERLRITLRSIGDAVIATDTAGAIVFQNPVAEALTGWSQQEARGKPLAEVFRIVDAETRVEAESPTARVLRDGAIVGPDGHTLLITRDGREVPIDDSGAPIRSADGTLLGVVLVFRDVSDREAAEAERWQLWRAEAARVEAERANAAKDAFLAVLSHELRSPLSAMLAWVGILERRSNDPAMLQRAVAVLQRSVRAQTELINHLLDVSRIVAGKLVLEHVPVDLVGAVSATLDELELAAQGKGVMLARDVCPGRLVLVGDEARLEEVVRNLVDNAIKFTPAGGHVDVVLRRDGRQAELMVSDSGEGFPPGRRDLIFDRFQQSAPQTRRHGGLGLGLAIVRHLVEEHGGTVSADSRGPGRGAVFVVRLPLTDGIAPPEPEPVPLIAASTSLAGVAVLLVEDDADWRDAVALRLRQVGAIVTTASGVSEAMAHLDAQPPAVLVSDIGMPEADGYELIRLVRGQCGWTIRAIAMTGFADPESRARCLELGFDEFLAKPFEPDRLIETIAALVVDHGSG